MNAQEKLKVHCAQFKEDKAKELKYKLGGQRYHGRLSSMVLEHKESSVVRNCWDEFL
jgi:hypothetical protein